MGWLAAIVWLSIAMVVECILCSSNRKWLSLLKFLGLFFILLDMNTSTSRKSFWIITNNQRCWINVVVQSTSALTQHRRTNERRTNTHLMLTFGSMIRHQTQRKQRNLCSDIQSACHSTCVPVCDWLFFVFHLIQQTRIHLFFSVCPTIRLPFLSDACIWCSLWNDCGDFE